MNPEHSLAASDARDAEETLSQGFVCRESNPPSIPHNTQVEQVRINWYLSHPAPPRISDAQTVFPFIEPARPRLACPAVTCILNTNQTAEL